MEDKNNIGTKQKFAERMLVWIFLLFITAAIIMAFYKYYILRDYFVEAQAVCDPETEKCFVYTCDPESDPTCPTDESEQTSYYKIVKKKAYLVPVCDPSSEECPKLNCEGTWEDCEESLCDENTKTEDEECNDPQQYVKENLSNEDEDEDVDAGNPEDGSDQESGQCSEDDMDCPVSD